MVVITALASVFFSLNLTLECYCKSCKGYRQPLVNFTEVNKGISNALENVSDDIYILKIFFTNIFQGVANTLCLFCNASEKLRI